MKTIEFNNCYSISNVWYTQLWANEYLFSVFIHSEPILSYFLLIFQLNKHVLQFLVYMNTYKTIGGTNGPQN